MHPFISLSRRALASVALSAALLALPGLTQAAAITSATVTSLFERVDFNPDITVRYEFNTAETVRSTSTSGNAIASALQTPETNIAEALFFQDQDAQSQAEAYKTGKGGLGSASANISNLAYVVLENSGPSDGNVTLGWEYSLEARQEVAGIHDFADAFAYAQIVMFDDFFAFDVDESVQTLYGGDQLATAADDGEVTLFVPAGDSNVLTIQLITEANAQFVPVPATAGLLALGLLGLRGVRRRSA